MNNYEIYKHSYRHEELGYKAVKIGLCWTALFFNIYWMLFEKLWAVLLLWLFSWFIVDLLASNGWYLMSTPLCFALIILPIFLGNQWQAINLRQSGYILLGEVEASSINAAIKNAANARPKQTQSATDASKETKSAQDFVFYLVLLIIALALAKHFLLTTDIEENEGISTARSTVQTGETALNKETIQPDEMDQKSKEDIEFITQELNKQKKQPVDNKKKWNQ